MSDITKPQRWFLSLCIESKWRGRIAFDGYDVRIARGLYRRKMIQKAPHNIVFWGGEKKRPWIITAAGFYAYHNFGKRK